MPLNLPTLKITKIRYAFSVALCADVAGIFTSVIVFQIIFDGSTQKPGLGKKRNLTQ
ncbi:MAG: hypothetical protein QNJ74_29530 [Trichodesmium sp. MO_231.B1]|nr:hypothetical protein [Trichodesmium sp. MO_231.B1]